MEIKNRLFPYPVLCDENDDYIDSKFEIKVTQMEELKDIILQFDIAMDNIDLAGLIRTGKAEYLIHIECGNTSFRKSGKECRKEFWLSHTKVKGK